MSEIFLAPPFFCVFWSFALWWKEDRDTQQGPPSSSSEQDPQEPVPTWEELDELHGLTHEEQEAQGGGVICLQ